MKKLLLLLLVSLFLIGCGTVEPVVDVVSEEVDDAVVEWDMEESVWFAEEIDDCDRFRPIFRKEIDKYPSWTMSIPALYALIYQESMCKTRDELEKIFLESGNEREDWKGGIMQVDSCWRFPEYPADCSNVVLEIEHGMSVLNNAQKKIKDIAKKNNISLRSHEKTRLLLIAYNRGFHVIENALELYGSDMNDTVFVNCTEKELCTDDLSYVDVDTSYAEDDLTLALLLGCRMEYGFFANSQGDYCIGEGYGLEYAEDVFDIYKGIISDRAVRDINDIFTLETKEKEFYIDEISFSGYEWLVKTSIGKAGPGPNYFYYNSTFVDEEGLHVQIVNDGEKWYSSEAVLRESLGYGKYEFEVAGDLHDLDENVVLGLFTYNLALKDDPDYFHQEIDFEISLWSGEVSQNTQFVIQAPFLTKPLDRFNLDYEGDLIVSFDWREDGVDFELRKSDGEIIRSWNYSGPHVPVPDEETTRVNLWLYKGAPPTDGEEVDVVIKKFSYSNPE